MDCDTCRGSPIPGMVITVTGLVACPNRCIGGIASCCDAAGSLAFSPRACPVGQPELRPNVAKAGDTSLPPVIPLDLTAGFIPDPGRHFAAAR